MICQDCHQRDAEAGTDTCFRCRVLTVGFGFRGGGFMYGRKQFAERTNAEFINEHMGEVKDNPDIAPAERGVWS